MAPRILLILFATVFIPSLLPLPSHSTLHNKHKSSSNDNHPSGFDITGVTQLSWHPRLSFCRGFLSHEECDHLIQLAKDKLEKSMVAGGAGKSIVSNVRTSTGMFLDKPQDEIVARIEARIAAWTFLPKENGESLQILRYEDGQKYEPHFDFFQDHRSLETSGNRVATVLMYLSDVQKGGETVFPYAKGNNPQLKDDSWSDCSKKGYAVKPKKGDAVLFFSLKPNATSTDTYSLHESCPVIEGEKWSATKWIHVRSFESLSAVPARRSTRDNCVDDDELLCPKWASRGECQKNPLYMVGSHDSLGFCRKSCKLCSV